MDRSEMQADAGYEQRPIDSVDGHVLAGSAGRNRMSFSAKRIDPIHRVEAQRPIGTTVVLPVALHVADNPERSHVGLLDGTFRHAAAGDVDRDDAPGHLV